MKLESIYKYFYYNEDLRDNFLVILGYLVKWSIILYGTVSNPLQNNLHVPIQFSNRTSLSKYLVQLFFSLLSPDYLLYYF